MQKIQQQLKEEKPQVGMRASWLGCLGRIADRCQHSLPEASEQDLSKGSSKFLPSWRDLSSHGTAGFYFTNPKTELAPKVNVPAEEERLCNRPGRKKELLKYKMTGELMVRQTSIMLQYLLRLSPRAAVRMTAPASGRSQFRLSASSLVQCINYIWDNTNVNNRYVWLGRLFAYF